MIHSRLVLCLALIAHRLQAADPPVLEQVAAFPDQQVTGVTVSAKGRVFVCFPFWSDGHTTSVAEIVDGKPVPYPDAAWNAKEAPAESRWVCVQSVVVDGNDSLWVLDPAAPKMESTVPGGPKLVKFDLATNKPIQTIAFTQDIVPQRAYLNDVRFDRKTGHAFITESGTGALIVVDLATGKAKRRLADHPSTKVEIDATLRVDGFTLVDPETGKTPAFHADGIALDESSGWLYYHALTGETMYRVKTSDLTDDTLSDTELAGKVENLGRTAKPDGMLESKDGRVYLTAFEQNALVRFDPRTKESDLVVHDDRLQWPDTLAWSPDGALYVTTSQIHRMPKYHGGKSERKGPFAVWKVMIGRRK